MSSVEARHLRAVRVESPARDVEQELALIAARIAAEHGPLEEVGGALAAYLLRPGKRVRARLCLAGEALATGRPPSDAAVVTAAALETVHAFLLVHDDVMDRADLRRGEPALHVALRPRSGIARERTGHDLAIVAGDWLYTAAMQALLETHDAPPQATLAVARMLLSTFAETARGQALDVVLGARPLAQVGLSEVLETYRLKTARYTFEAPLVAGAMLGGADEALLGKLRAFAASAGVAFQLVDDLLGLFATEAELGKPPEADLAEGKKTWPLVRAYARARLADRAWLAELLERRSANAVALEAVRLLVRSTGVFDESLALVRGFVEDALRSLDGLPPGPAREELVAIVESLQSRARALAPPVRGAVTAPASALE